LRVQNINSVISALLLRSSQENTKKWKTSREKYLHLTKHTWSTTHAMMLPDEASELCSQRFNQIGSGWWLSNPQL
jgi:hypothetical protein